MFVRLNTHSLSYDPCKPHPRFSARPQWLKAACIYSPYPPICFANTDSIYLTDHRVQTSEMRFVGVMIKRNKPVED